MAWWRHPALLLLVVVLVVGACGSTSTPDGADVAPPAPTSADIATAISEPPASGGATQAAGTAGSAPSDGDGDAVETTLADLGTEGSATLSYSYVVDRPKEGRVNVLQVDVPLVIEQSTDDPMKYEVSGFAAATGYTQQMGSNGCFIQCDLPAQYRVEGKVIQTPVDMAGNCIISLEVWQKFDDVEPYGDCPDFALNVYKCALHKTDYGDGRTYRFDGDSPVVTPTDVGEGLTIKAELSDVVIPPAIRDTCRWAE